MRKKEIDIVTLGCAKNLVDAERLMFQLQQQGFTCTHDPADPQGEIVVINTCGFIGDAKEESINTILQFVERKRNKQVRKIYVMGCLSERYLADLETEIPEVDGWVGKFDYMNLLQQIISDATTINSTYHRLITTPQHYTYLKISEGCDRFCSYCAIPLITGRHTSRKLEDIRNEVQWLSEQGVKEINVIAQDLSSYGKDLYNECRLAELLDRMAQIKGIEWIRLHYAYPADFPMNILPIMAKHKNICNYLDIALQHSTDHMLSLMRRHITALEQDNLIKRIRKEVPGICLRTTIMVGHPGETENDFEQLKQWVQQMRFDRLGVFAYSDEDGTYANKHYEDHIPQAEKERRANELMNIQQQISAELTARKINSIQRVIIDRLEGNYYIGRTEQDSPDVDCEVLIEKTTDNNLQIGAFYNVRIISADDFDLYAQLC